MSDASIGPLVAADESLHHQVVDTFGRVGSTDLNWTEKIWAQCCARDGALQIAFGLGKYANRNVLDAFAGVGRGTEQWTVRGSRSLHSDPDHATVGPIRYEIPTALDAARLVLEPNDLAPIAFDVVLRGAVPARMEDRELLLSPHANRIVNDVVRYHQTGILEGWIEIGGERRSIGASDWMGARDHSWGIRTQVGDPPRDLEPGSYPSEPRSFTSWSPVLMERPDGTRYALFHYFMESNLPGQPQWRLRGGIEHPDGSEEVFRDVDLDIRIDDDTRRFLGGTYTFRMSDGSTRPITYTPAASGTGFHLGTGLYFGLDGRRHGQWRGELELDADHYVECDTRAVAQRIHQHRDCVVAVDDPVGGGRGWGSVQTIAIGGDDRYGTTLAKMFI